MESTTSRLLKENADLILQVTKHRLPQELCEGTLHDEILYVYAAQDLKFFQIGLRTLAYFTSQAPDDQVFIRLCQQIGFLSNDENDYFEKCLKLTEKPHLVKFKSIVLPKVQQYLDFLDGLKKESFATWATHMWCCEFVYWRWAHDLPRKDGLEWKHAEWIRLHDGEHFEEWCNFLEGIVNRFSFEEVNAVFVKTLQLEIDFFDACYHPHS